MTKEEKRGIGFSDILSRQKKTNKVQDRLSGNQNTEKPC